MSLLNSHIFFKLFIKILMSPEGIKYNPVFYGINPVCNQYLVISVSDFINSYTGKVALLY